jgi:hypothetical protein
MPLPRVPGADEVCLFVHTADGREGPLSRRQIAKRLEDGLSPKAHLWMEGMEGWEPLSDHEQLTDDLGEPPGAVPQAPGESDDDYKDRLFGDLVEGSWAWLYEHEFAGHIDEVFLGAIITSTLDAGYALIDITSDGTRHYLRFEEPEANSRLIVRLNHLTNTLATARVLGQRARVTLGYGERVRNIGKIMNALRSEMQSGYLQPEPGTITVDGDLQSGYVYVQVELFLAIDEYVSPTYDIDYDRLTAHVDATAHALRKYLRGRFQEG